jgi:hypothetical protein
MRNHSGHGQQEYYLPICLVLWNKKRSCCKPLSASSEVSKEVLNMSADIVPVIYLMLIGDAKKILK